MTQQRNPRMPVFAPSLPAPAPRLTKDGFCSDCQVRAVLAGEDELKVCPKCYAMLWHADWSAEEKRIRAERAILAAMKLAEVKQKKHEAFVARQTARGRLENPKTLSAKNLTTSRPVLGMPTLTENKPDDVPIQSSDEAPKDNANDV
jgi:NMD protein affecting ribosome stability and mRNA decay